MKEPATDLGRHIVPAQESVARTDFDQPCCVRLERTYICIDCWVQSLDLIFNAIYALLNLLNIHSAAKLDVQGQQDPTWAQLHGAQLLDRSVISDNLANGLYPRSLISRPEFPMLLSIATFGGLLLMISQVAPH
jgi:hypothetical protein